MQATNASSLQGKSTPLKFGSIISLSSVIHPNSFIYIDGFVKDTVLVKKFKQRSKHDVQNPEQVEKKPKSDEPTNPKLMYNKCLFQIYPVSSISSQKKALDKKDAILKEAENPVSNQSNHDALLEFQNSLIKRSRTKPEALKEFKKSKTVSKSTKQAEGNEQENKTKAINAIQEEIITECKVNHENFMKVSGNSVVFGQSVQLLHVVSNKFLYFENKESEIERHNCRVGLTEYSGENTLFKFLPCYNHQKDNEGTIFLNNGVYIASSVSSHNRILYLNISNSAPAKVDKQKLGIVKTDKGKKKREANMSYESREKLKINLFSNTDNSENNNISCGDIVWLDHSEISACLVSSKQFKDSSLKPTLEFDLGRASEQFRNTNGMWIISNEKHQVGGYVEWGGSYRFKHLSSGLYLTVKEIHVDKLNGDKPAESGPEYIVTLAVEPNEDNVFSLIAVPSTLPKDAQNRQYVTKESFVWIKHKKSNRVMNADVPIDLASKKALAEGDSKFSNFGQIKPFLIKTKDVVEHAAFNLVKADFNEAWETNFLISCFPILKNFHDSIIAVKGLKKKEAAALAEPSPSRSPLSAAKLDAHSLDDYIIVKISTLSTCIRDLDQYCTNKRFNVSYDQKYGHVNPFRQKLLKEQFFIDILVMILKEIVDIDELETYKREILDKEKNKKPESYREDDLFASNDHVACKPTYLALLAKKHSNTKTIQNLKEIKNADDTARLNFIKKKVDLCPEIYSLLKNICKDNYNNEVYTYSLLYDFLIHCKYLTSAVDCVMSIIQGNDYILNKVNENVKIDIDNRILKQEATQIINIVINIKHTQNIQNPDEIIDVKSNAAHSNKSRISRPVNLINFFLNLLNDQNDQDVSAQFLQFFGKIACRDGVGLSINQDLLFRIFTKNPKFVEKFMIQFEENGRDNQITLKFPINWGNRWPDMSIKDFYTEENKLKQYKSHLEEQIKLYSNLTMTRNYLWSKYLENRFPLASLCEIIADKTKHPYEFPESLKAAMCTLILTIHIDREPFNQLKLPVMCRIYNPDDLDGSEQVTLKKNEETLQQLLTTLSNDLKKVTGEITEELKAHEIKRRDGVSAQLRRKDTKLIRNRLDNIYVLNCTQLYGKAITFDFYKELTKLKEGKRQNLSNIVCSFVKLLEFDPDYHAYTLLLSEIRVGGKEKERFKKKKKGWKTALFEHLAEFAGEMKELTMQKKDEVKNTANVELDNLDAENTPLMRHMLNLHNDLERMKTGNVEAKQKEKIDIQVKLEICDTLEFLLDMRNNYLMTNFVAWFHDIKKEGLEKVKKPNSMSFVNKYLPKILPPIPKTGISDIDEEYVALSYKAKHLLLPFSEENKEPILVDYTAKSKKSKSNKNYVEDLDTLFVNGLKEDPHNVNFHGILPSLLVTFLNAKDSVLENRLLDIIMRLFNQRTELFNCLNNLEISFNEDEKNYFRLIEKNAKQLKKLTEQLEVLIHEFMEADVEEKKPEEQDAIAVSEANKNEVPKLAISTGEKLKSKDFEEKKAEELPKVKSKSEIDIDDMIESLENLINLLNSNSGSSTGASNDSTKKSQQKIMQCMEIHNSALIISRNTLHYLNDIILIQKISTSKKSKLANLLVKTHIFLQEFCKGNEVNQNLLVEHQDILLEYGNIDVGQIELLCSIYQGNRRLCESVSDTFLRRFLALIQVEGRQANYLKIFKVIQKLGPDTYIPDNQFKVLKILINSENDINDKLAFALYSYFNPVEQAFSFDFSGYFDKKINQDLILELSKMSFMDTYRDQPFHYHAQLLEVLICSIKNTQALNMTRAKLKQLFSLPSLLDLISRSDNIVAEESPNEIMQEETDYSKLKKTSKVTELLTKKKKTLFRSDTNIFDKNPALDGETNHQIKEGFTLIKSSLIDFVTELYFEKSGNAFEEITNSYNEFDALIKRETERLKAFNSRFGPNKEFMEYFCGHLLRLFRIYARYFYHDKFNPLEIKSQDKQMPFTIFLDQLLISLPYFDFTAHSTYKRQLYKFFEEFDERYKEIFPNYDRDIQYVENLQTEQRMSSIPRSPGRASWRKSSKGGSPNKMDISPSKSLGRSEYSPLKSAVKSDDYSFSKTQMEHDNISVHLQQEPPSPSNSNVKNKEEKREWATKENWRAVINAFIEKNTEWKEAMELEKKVFSKAILSYSDLFTEEEKNNKSIKLDSKDIIKKLVKYLQFGLSNKAKKKTIISTLQTLKKMMDEEDDEEKAHKQNLLDRCDATKMLLSVLADPSEEMVDVEVFNNFLEFGIKLLEGGNPRIQKNIHTYFINFPKSEVLFAKFHSIISNYSDSLTKDDMGNSSSQKNDIFLESNSETKRVVLENVIRLLQLFAEGHFTDLQNYIRYQSNSRNNYDMLVAVIDLIRSHKELTVENYGVLMRCLDTLAEFVQGPCPENQIAIVDGKFLDVACNLLGLKDVNDKSLIYRSKRKSSTIVLSPSPQKSPQRSPQSGRRNIEGPISPITSANTRLLKPKKSVRFTAVDSVLISRVQTSNSPTKSPSFMLEGRKFSVKGDPSNQRYQHYNNYSEENVAEESMFTNKGLTRWMIARIQYKTLILVMSLLESKKDSSMIRKIIRSLPIEVLKDTLAEVWRRYRELYGTKYDIKSLCHHEGDPYIQVKFKPKKKTEFGYYDLITETGFISYFLLESYYEANDFDADRDVVDEVMVKKKQSNTKKMSLFESNLVVQAGSFGVSIVSQGVSSASAMKKKFDKKRLGIDDEEHQKFEIRQLTREGLKFFAEHSAHIEVIRNKNIEKVYFNLPPYCHFLPKDVKVPFNDTVDRTTVQTKANGLVTNSNDIIKIMQHQERLNTFFDKNKFLAVFANYVNLWKDLAFTVAIVVNFLIIGSYSGYFGDDSEDIKHRRLFIPRIFLISSQTSTLRIIQALAICMCVASLFVVTFFMIDGLPLIVTQIWQTEGNQQNKRRKKGILLQATSVVGKSVLTFIKLLTTPIVVYYLLYGAFAIVGVAYHPFFLAFHLTEIVLRFSTLKDVIRSFWNPRKALALTFLLFIIFEYFFTLIAYVYFYNDYAGFCESTLDCFLYTFDYTFKANGGIGGQLISLTPPIPGEVRIGRFFFDNAFNILIVIIIVSVVSGNIIDTFGSLREKEKNKIQDVQQICFICGFDRETFDKKADLGGGFDAHIKIDHYMWNYLHFIAYLKEKPSTDYTGIESYISEKIKKGDVSWFPANKTLALENPEDDIDDRIDDEITDIDKNTKKIKDIPRHLNSSLKAVKDSLNRKPKENAADNAKPKVNSPAKQENKA